MTDMTSTISTLLRALFDISFAVGWLAPGWGRQPHRGHGRGPNYVFVYNSEVHAAEARFLGDHGIMESSGNYILGNRCSRNKSRSTGLFSRGLQGLESALQWKRIEWPAGFSVAERAVSLDMSNPLNTERLTFARGGVFRPSGDENGLALRAARLNAISEWWTQTAAVSHPSTPGQ